MAAGSTAGRFLAVLLGQSLACARKSLASGRAGPGSSRCRPRRRMVRTEYLRLTGIDWSGMAFYSALNVGDIGAGYVPGGICIVEPSTSRRLHDNRFSATNDGNRSERVYQCCRAASGSGIRGGSICCRGIDRGDGKLRCWSLIAICLCFGKDTAVEQQIALLRPHLLSASRPNFLGNPASFKLSPCIRFIATALILDGVAALRDFGATARRIVYGHLSECRNNSERGSDHEKCSDHCGPLLSNTDFAFALHSYIGGVQL